MVSDGRRSWRALQSFVHDVSSISSRAPSLLQHPPVCFDRSSTLHPAAQQNGPEWETKLAWDVSPDWLPNSCKSGSAAAESESEVSCHSILAYSADVRWERHFEEAAKVSAGAVNAGQLANNAYRMATSSKNVQTHQS